MADQNQNLLLAPVVEDEEFFSAEDFFSASADNSVDWDTLMTRGSNSNNGQHSLSNSRWERDSLYVKFDPLISSKRESLSVANGNATSDGNFVFKVPKLPLPAKLASATTSSPLALTHLLNVSVTTSSGDGDDEGSSVGEAEQTGGSIDYIGDCTTGSDLSFLCNGMAGLQLGASFTNEGGDKCELSREEEPAEDINVEINPSTCSSPTTEAALNSTFTADPNANFDGAGGGDGNDNVADKYDGAETILVEYEHQHEEPGLKNETLSDIVPPDSFDTDNECGLMEVLEASPTKEGEEVEEEEEHHNELEQDISKLSNHPPSPAEPHRLSSGNVASEANEEKTEEASAVLELQKPSVSRFDTAPSSSKSTTTKRTVSKEDANTIMRIKEKMAKLAALKKEFEDETKIREAELMKDEMELIGVVQKLQAEEEEFQRIMEEKQRIANERETATMELRGMEAAFAEMLMMYENSKKAQNDLEQNIELLKVHNEAQKEAITRRQSRDAAASEMVKTTVERMNADFEEKTKEREQDNVRLKAKIRMADMKTAKLVAEIQQVETESEKLRTLCNDVLKT